MTKDNFSCLDLALIKQFWNAMISEEWYQAKCASGTEQLIGTGISEDILYKIWTISSQVEVIWSYYVYHFSRESMIKQ